MNNPYPHPILAREGWPFIAISIIAALILSKLWLPLGILGWIAVVFVVQFFRDPARPVPSQANAVLSPADGRIVVVEEADDPWLNRRALKISVFMNVFNVHSNRSPLDAEVIGRWYHAGQFVNAALAKASVENERNALHLRTGDGQDVTCVQIAGLVARRILCYVDQGAKLFRGQRYGFIRFGSRVDLYLPLSTRPLVSVGDKVKATTTILAELAQVAETETD